jgi:hypothetical protein
MDDTCCLLGQHADFGVWTKGHVMQHATQFGACSLKNSQRNCERGPHSTLPILSLHNIFLRDEKLWK